MLTFSDATMRREIAGMTGQDLYRIRDFVPEFDQIAAETRERSRALAGRARIWSGCAYGPRPRECMDILLPQRLRQGAPIHMFVHGGYWRSGEKDAYTCLALPVLVAGGIAAIVEYDLMPGTRLAGLVDQVRRAAAWLAGQAPGIGADPLRLSVSGHSAGAHLASLLAAAGPLDRQMPGTPLAGMLLASGIYDLSGIPGSFLRDEARMTPQEADDWSPLAARHAVGPRRVIAVGARETAPFQSQAAALHLLLREQGHAVDLLVAPRLDHMNIVLDLADPDRPLGQHLMALVADSRSTPVS